MSEVTRVAKIVASFPQFTPSPSLLANNQKFRFNPEIFKLLQKVVAELDKGKLAALLQTDQNNQVN